MEDEEYYNSNVSQMTILDKGKGLFVVLFMNILKTSFVTSGEDFYCFLSPKQIYYMEMPINHVGIKGMKEVDEV
jgi:hypothetical protein